MFSHVNYTSIKLTLKERTVQWDVDWQVCSLSCGTWFHMEVDRGERCHRLWVSLEGLSPKLQDLRASGIHFALGEGWTKPSLQSLIWELCGLGKSWLCSYHEFIMFFGTSTFSPFNFSETPTHQKRNLPWNCCLDECDICKPATETGGADVFATHSLISRPTLSNSAHTWRWGAGGLLPGWKNTAQ